MYNRSSVHHHQHHSQRAHLGNSILSFVILWLTATTATVRTVVAVTDDFCPEQYWWDYERDDCMPCTVCDEQSIVLRPCQPHQDVVCGTLNDLEFDLNWLAGVDEPKQRVSATISPCVCVCV